MNAGGLRLRKVEVMGLEPTTSTLRTSRSPLRSPAQTRVDADQARIRPTARNHWRPFTTARGTTVARPTPSSVIVGTDCLRRRGVACALARIPERHFGDAIPGLTDGILGQCPDRARSTALCSARLPRPSGRDTYVGVFPMPSTSATASGSARRRPASYCSLKAASPSVNDRTRAPT
jgi:hypothetical protein